MPKRVPVQLEGSLAIAAVGIIVAFSVMNYAYHYDVLPLGVGRSAVGYFLAVQLPFGIALPSVVLGFSARAPNATLSSIGVSLGARDGVAAVAALIAGAVMVGLALGGDLAGVGLVRIGTLFAQLLVASTAEVLIFTGLLLALARRWCRGIGRWETPCAVLASALGFGLFHFTYPPPWATWSVALGLAVVWIGVNLVFLVTHALLAAIVFNNCMALIGFVQNDLTLPLGVAFGLTSWLVAIGIALGTVITFSRRPENTMV
jgi:hypothetical protein